MRRAIATTLVVAAGCTSTSGLTTNDGADGGSDGGTSPAAEGGTDAGADTAEPPRCGDGFIDPGEECDGLGDAGCNSSCKIVCNQLDEYTSSGDRHCYRMNNSDKQAWVSARDFCLSWNGDLAAPSSALELQLFVAKPSISPPTGKTWLGGTDFDGGTFGWVNGEPWSAETVWDNGFPQTDGGAPKHCVLFPGGASLENQDCNNLYPFVCERPPPGRKR